MKKSIALAVLSIFACHAWADDRQRQIQAATATVGSATALAATALAGERGPWQC